MLKLRPTIIAGISLVSWAALAGAAEAECPKGANKPPATQTQRQSPPAKASAPLKPQPTVAGLTVDKHGIIRDRRGEPVGVSGVDGRHVRGVR